MTPGATSLSSATGLGRQVIQAAIGGSSTLNDPNKAKVLRLIDMARQMAMMNAIFGAANMPLVDRDL